METLWHLFLDLVVGIAAGLAIQPLQRWWETRPQKAHLKRIKHARYDYIRTLTYAERPELLSAYMIMRISILFPTILLFVLLGHLTEVQASHHIQIPYVTAPLRLYPLGLSALFAVIVFMVVLAFSIVLSCRELYYNILFFEWYVRSIPDEIRDLARETAIVKAKGNALA